MRRPRTNENETGATAVLVALMATVLLGLVAFTTDFGLAYANKRAMQSSADAAALGAAGVFAQQQYRECVDIRTHGLSAANAEAIEKVGQNDTGSSPASLTTFTATCEDGDLVVRTTATGPSPNLFGRILGRNGDYEVARSAAAAVEAGTTGVRLRPMALCASDLPADAQPGTAFNLYAPGDGDGNSGNSWGTSSCPLPDNTGAGNWWTLDCPNESTSDGNGTAAIEEQIRNGCSTPISVVPGQGTATGQALNDILSGFCKGSVSTTDPFACLGGDPGQPDAGHIEKAWRELIDKGITVPIPVVCGPKRADGSGDGLCAQSSITGTGTNAVFPVHKLVAVQVCGFHFGKQNKVKYKAPTTVTGCQEAAVVDVTKKIQPDNSDDIYLTLVARNLQISNVTGDSECDLGDDGEAGEENCDGGLRQVRLVE